MKIGDKLYCYKDCSEHEVSMLDDSTYYLANFIQGEWYEVLSYDGISVKLRGHACTKEFVLYEYFAFQEFYGERLYLWEYFVNESGLRKLKLEKIDEGR